MKKICKIPNILFFVKGLIRPKKEVFILLILLTQPLSSFAQAEDWWKMDLEAADGTYFSPSALSAEQGLLILFMDPDCPVTQKYGATIREIYQHYQDEGVQISAVYPVVNAEAEKIRAFAENYNFPFPQLLDPRLEFTKSIGASITPEVFLLDAHGNILYQGAIDNWFYELGRYRRVITEHYLKDALEAHLSGEKIPVKHTKAVGCMIGTGMLHDSEHH